MQSIDPEIKKAFLSDIFRPAILHWNRLEGRPRKEEIDRTLKAEIRDPLWMLCRQWQFGEFKGEDAGSAISAKTQISTTRLNRFAARGGKTFPYDESTPLETRVESERIQIERSLQTASDLSLRIEIGLHWFKLLKQFSSEDLRAVYLDEYAFDDLANISDPTAEQRLALAYLRSDQKGWQTFEAAKNRVADGFKLLQAIADLTHQSWLDAHTEIPETEKPKITDAAAALAQWFGRIYFQPDAEAPSPWAPSYLEYQFLNSAPAAAGGEQRIVLEATEYHGGRLDWYAYDVRPDDGALPPDVEGAEINEHQVVLHSPLSFIPTQVEFSGMPNVRWWALEDRHIDFGQLKTSTTDIAQLMLAEFGLIYGNDWTVIPYNLQTGSIAEVKGIVVTDVFGVRTFIRPAGSGADWQRWSVYKLSTIGESDSADTRLFMAPAIGKLQEGKPRERVVLARDEMANMVWGVEETIAGILGAGTNGFEAATALETFFQENQAPVSPGSTEETSAKIRYVLGSTVPENWIPFIPVRTEGSDREIQLQRAAMPRLSDLIPNSIVEPRTQLLRPGLDETPKKPYHVHEQEILRAGVVLTRGFQRTRWFDGRVFTWIGRRRQTGLGEGASGLIFDQIVPSR